MKKRDIKFLLQKNFKFYFNICNIIIQMFKKIKYNVYIISDKYKRLELEYLINECEFDFGK